MKGDGCDFEQQTNHGRDQRDDDNGIVRILSCDSTRDYNQLGAACNSVEKRQPIGKDSR